MTQLPARQGRCTHLRSQAASLVLFTAALLIPGVIGAATNDAPGRVREELQGLAGADAVACGEVALDVSRAKAAACARQAVSSGRAFWVAFQRRGTDSLVWEGAAGDGRPPYWALFYDSDITGGSSGESLLGVTPCTRLRFARWREPVVECTELEGER